MRRTVTRGRWAGPALAVALAALAAAPAADPDDGWVTIDYGELVDRRELTHSGEPVGVLLERPSDPRTLALLDPVLERYAFVLPDAFDAMGGFRPRTELGRLWPEGGSEPAWVELLRARRYVVESDGQGGLRLFLPVAGTGGDAARSAEAAWKEAWPVLRHVLAAERRRRPGPLAAEVHPYVHELSRARFRVGRTALRREVGPTEAEAAAPLDLDGWQRHLDRGLTLDGARLTADGSVRLLGEDRGRAATLLGRALALSDLSVAWRAVAHGGLAEPYMSLDRGDRPWTTRVTYGGRLRDTALGLVSLRCDVRFKTFSLGLAEDGRSDLRERLRAAVPGFRTHLERFAADPGSRGTWSQQTRLWFYPDEVEMALSASGDALVLGRARMTAASERQAEGREEDPVWTRDTVLAINGDYDRLAATLPELHDLDQVVRLLSLATWLQQARADGLAVPDLDVLLDVTLPAEPTPRSWPQVLAFNALPPAGEKGEVQVIGRPEVGEGLERLQPWAGRLPARRRLTRALGALDASRPDHAVLLREAEGAGAALGEGEIDLLAWRAERLGMHALVLGTLPQARLQGLSREAETRLFSVGIGGLDLGMRRVLARAPRRSLALRGSAARVSTPRPAPRILAAPATAGPPSPVRFRGAVPPHAPGQDDPCDGAFEDAGRLVRFDAACRPEAVVRREGGRRLVFRFERQETTWTARSAAGTTSGPPAAEPTQVPPRLALLSLAPGSEGGTESGTESGTVTLRLQAAGRRLEAALPRRAVQRLLLGPGLAPAGTATLPGLVPPAAEMAGAAAWMLWTPHYPVEDVPGEEDPARLAGALRAASIPTVVGVGPRAAERWAAAPAIARALLLAPADAFPGASLAPLRDAVRRAWGRAPAGEALPARKIPDLVILVSGEPPAVLASRAAVLAADPRLAGRHLAVVSLAGELDPALAMELLGAGPAGGPGGVALSAALPGHEGVAVERLREVAAALESARGRARVERLGDLGTWIYGDDEVSVSPAPGSPGTPPPSPSRTRSRR